MTENPDGYEIEPLSSGLGLVNSNPPFYWLTQMERSSNGTVVPAMDPPDPTRQLSGLHYLTKWHSTNAE